MGQFYAIGDIHGRLDLLQSALRDWNRDSEQLIFMGDYIDYGPYSNQTLVELAYLQQHYGAIILRGHHEEYLKTFLEESNVRHYPAHDWRQDGREECLRSFFNDEHAHMTNQDVHDALLTQFPKLLGFIDSMALYHETDTLIFAHAGIDLMALNWRESLTNASVWPRGEFVNGRNQTNKTIIFGHSRTGVIRGLKAGKTQSELYGMPFLDDRVWVSPCGTKVGIDGGSVFGGYLHGLHIDEDRDEIIVTSVHQNGDRKKSILLPGGGTVRATVS